MANIDNGSVTLALDKLSGVGDDAACHDWTVVKLGDCTLQIEISSSVRVGE